MTAEVREYREWFGLTHQLAGGPGWVGWQRTALPVAGGLEDQPAKLMAALDCLAAEENALILRARPRRAKASPRRRGRG
jgi:hypothetical protein